MIPVVFNKIIIYRISVLFSNLFFESHSSIYFINSLAEMPKIPDGSLRGFERCILRLWKGNHIRWHTSNIYVQPEIIATIILKQLFFCEFGEFPITCSGEFKIPDIVLLTLSILLTSKILSFSPLLRNTEGFHSQALAIITLLAPLSFQNFLIPAYVFATLSRLLVLPPLAITGIVAY